MTDLFKKKVSQPGAAPVADPPAEVIAHKPETAVVSAAEAAELGFTMEDSFEGVEPRLPQIKIVSQGQVFAMPDESKVDELTCIIVDSNRCNAWWAESFAKAGGGNPPDCASFDGVQPYTEEPKASDCAKCSLNRYGSDGHRGKACKNMRRVHVILEGAVLPHRITLPPTSLRSYDDYVTSLINQKVFHYAAAVTRLTLTKEKNKDGIEYSSVCFELVQPITAKAELIRIATTRKRYLRAMRQQDIQVSEYGADEAEPF